MVLFWHSGWGLVVSEPVACAFEVEDVGLVDDSIDHRRGHNLVGEDLAPPGEGQVAGHNQGGVFVAGGHQLEEQVRSILIEGNVADLIDDE